MTTPSQLRQRLAQLADEIPALVEPAHERSPLWRGIVYQARRKCGKQGCRCMRGQPHVSWTLSDRSGQRPRTFTLTGPDLELFRRMSESYRRLRRGRARLVKITDQMLATLDQLEEHRRDQAVQRYEQRLTPGRWNRPSS
jgi:hypothetical protein